MFEKWGAAFGAGEVALGKRCEVDVPVGGEAVFPVFTAQRLHVLKKVEEGVGIV